ncbi:MAG: class I SAM-dependent methyltransferase [Acidimicrobiales bacterium]|nr:class I SAM-dependent methyltransferase [Acidimicrobiales bacterium]
MTFFDEQVAARYDEACGELNEPAVLEPTVACLADLAGSGRALEFAIGTGRVALPLAAAGVDVHGLEISQPMVDQLRTKPGGDHIPVTIGDMATTRVEGEFALVYLVYNTIENLLTQEEQVRCFQNAAAHLTPDGCFLIEVAVPNLRRLPPGETHVPFDLSPDHLGIDEFDVVNQRLVSHHYWVGAGEARAFHSEHRYAWPAEYDLMARLAGMELAARWSDWHRDPFTAESGSHISVWRPSG